MSNEQSRKGRGEPMQSHEEHNTEGLRPKPDAGRALSSDATTDSMFAELNAATTGLVKQQGILATLRERDARQTFLLRVADALRPLADPVMVQGEACRLLAEQLDVDRAYYVAIDEQAGLSSVERDFVRHGAPSLVGVHRIADFGWSVEILRRGECHVVANTQDSPFVPSVDRPALAALEIIGCMGAPLIKEGQLMGALCVTTKHPREWSEVEVELLRDVGERIWAAVERARAEAALRESEARIRIAVEAAELGTWEWNILSGEVFWNLQHFVLFGIEPRPNPVSAQLFFDHVHPDERERIVMLLQAAIASQGVFDADFRVLLADGSMRWMSGYGRVIEAVNGQSLRMSGVMFDITARKKAEAALRESEVRFRTLTDALPQVIWTNEAGGAATYFNQRWYSYSGLSHEESVGPGWQVIVHPDDGPASVERWQQALASGVVFDTEYRLRRADGTYRWHLGRNIPVRDGDEHVIGWFGSATDIDDLKQAEAAVQRARDELELHVAERTQELAAANQSLRQEIAIRRQLEAQRAMLMERIITAQEGERQRIARELHDTLGQFISALSLRLSIAQSLEGVPPEVREELAQLRSLTSRVDQEVDRLTMELRPPALEHLGLADALQSYAEEWAATSGVQLDVLVNGFESARLPSVVETTAYRIVQEALTNVLKHAQATMVSIIVEREPRMLRVIVEDNGVGFEHSGARNESIGGRQVGLIGMSERAVLAGGEIRVESASGTGTAIYLYIPLDDQTREDPGDANG
jgi:PAS domain S-box-containing protein